LNEGAGIGVARYAFERNHVDDWMINNMQPYMFISPFSNGVGGTQNMVWLAGQ